MSNDARFDPRFDPAFQPGYDGPPAATPAAQPAPVAAKPPVAFVGIAAPSPSEDGGSPEPRPVGINPFVTGLGAAAVVLVAVGFYLVALTGEIYNAGGGAPGLDYASFQMLSFAAPLVITLGIATAVGILFLFAARWWRPRL